MLEDLIEYTTRSVFLTGKAGTGKTTFLNNFVRNTQKKYVIAAPTGIAAINAGGVTLHSLFGLPLNNFIPSNDPVDINSALNRSQLMPHFRYQMAKKTLLLELELLIIDEVSMLRADVLDAIDLALRTVRRRPTPFGGVQLLFVGDLYQLPPVVRFGQELMEKYYPSQFFFEAHALQNKELMTVNLEKVYRQVDENFIHILNEVRNGSILEQDLAKLNERFLPDFDPQNEAYIYLVSHNHIADSINQNRLDKLSEKSFSFSAQVHGDFKQNQYPNEQNLTLKKGAQVMFIRNDSSADKNYYNGKLAQIIALSEDEIKVKLQDSDLELVLSKETWEQKTYKVDKETQEIKQEVQGSYRQYPIKLAWAVTIHKSQGLTFDKIIIDAGNSFASGQVYVALSRCRTLEGIVLKSKIHKHAIFIDHRIEAFQQKTQLNQNIELIIEQERYDYALGKFKDMLDFAPIATEITEWKSLVKNQKILDIKAIHALIESMEIKFVEWNIVVEKFMNFLKYYFEIYKTQKENWDAIEDKSEKAVAYFVEELHGKIYEPLLEEYKKCKGQKGLKAYSETLRDAIALTQGKIQKLKISTLFDHPLYSKKLILIEPSQIKKKATYLISFELYQQGKNIKAIAKERELTENTVFGHLAKMVLEGKIPKEELLEPKHIETFAKIAASKDYKTLSEWKNNLPSYFEYHHISLLMKLNPKNETAVK